MRPLKLLSLLPYTAPHLENSGTVFSTVLICVFLKINRQAKKVLDGIHTCVSCVSWFPIHTGSPVAQPPRGFTLYAGSPLHASQMRLALVPLICGLDVNGIALCTEAFAVWSFQPGDTIFGDGFTLQFSPRVGGFTRDSF